ncbi:MAG: sugar phosphate isomerase/epimerase [Floccifex porci]|uniref:sugar phosphate isomerase/epimerase family protein n=1 Tax=Floccifex porci TaxID=2606629 RepID=UPI0023F15E99|nr:sugar phosphate isomerase/epimerase family protein [Floccifex porci]MDD7467881.1 sugar phosphate isomerase/epimerase [Floccifex porci]
MNLGIISDQINLDLEKAIQIIKNQGYNTIELHSVFNKPVETLNEEETRKAVEICEKYEMKVSNLATTLFFLCPLYEEDKVSLFNDSFHCIKGNVKDHLNHIENACRVAKAFGCDKLRMFPFRFPDNRKPPFGTEKDMETICTYFQMAADIAQQYDCTLIIENCPYSHCPKGEMTLKLLKMCNRPNLKLLWDPANSYRAYQNQVEDKYLHKTLLEELKWIYPYIGHIHIKDYHYDSNFEKPFIHKPIYSGDIDFDVLFQYLKEKEYPYTLSLEPEVAFEEAILCMKRLKEKA